MKKFGFAAMAGLLSLGLMMAQDPAPTTPPATTPPATTDPAAAAASTDAARKKGRVGNRKDRQQKRIAKGVESGELTAAETSRLEKREAALNKQIREDRKDGGGMTAKERAKIEARQDRISKDIHKQKHDKQKQQ